MKRRVDQRLEKVPYLLPTLADGLAEAPRMLCAQHWDISVVIDRHILRPPPQKQRKAVGQREPSHHPQRWRPRFSRPQRRLCPVKGTDAFAHFTDVGQKTIRIDRRGSSLIS